MIRRDHGTRAVLFSASDPYFNCGADELRAAFDGARVERVGPDAGRVTGAGVGISRIAAACHSAKIGFVRHLAEERVSIPAKEVRVRPTGIAAIAISLLHDAGLQQVAVQVWGTGVGTGGLRSALAHAIERSGIRVAKGGEQFVLGVCLSSEIAVVALTRRQDSLCDWPGGRVALATSDCQVSRAEFKLEELSQVFPMPFARGGRALDLGASPGGWVRILRRFGFAVWAVDPAPLDNRVMADDLVFFYQTTAGRFFRQPTPRFDVVVNDMRMSPELSCRVMVEAARNLVRGGYGIVTLKTSPRHTLPTIRRALRVFSQTYEVVFLRQLYHNRNEVTVVGRVQTARSTHHSGRTF